MLSILAGIGAILLILSVLSIVNTVNSANTAGDIKYFIVGSRILSLDFFYHLLTFSEQSGSIQ